MPTVVAGFLRRFLRLCPNRGIRKLVAKTLGPIADGQVQPTPYGFDLTMRVHDNTNRIVFERGLGAVSRFVESMPNDALFIDIGGNQGATALLASNEPDRKIIVFEPSKWIFDLLRRNVELNA